jgi:hypothetical protein
MTKANIAIYIATIRQALDLEPCTEDEMTTHVNQIKENLDTKWYYFWIRSLYFDGPWVRNLCLVELNERLRDHIEYYGLSPIKEMIACFEREPPTPHGPIHAAFQMFVFFDKWKLVHNTNRVDPQDCPTIQAGRTHHYCTCELEQRTFMAMMPSLPDHPNPDDIKRFSSYR